MVGRGMYPPIQRMSAHLGAGGGRDYLVNLVLYGLYTGTYGAPMPPMPELSDAEVAAVNNYLLTQFAAAGSAPDTGRLYLPREVGQLAGVSSASGRGGYAPGGAYGGGAGAGGVSDDGDAFSPLL